MIGYKDPDKFYPNYLDNLISILDRIYLVIAILSACGVLWLTWEIVLAPLLIIYVPFEIQFESIIIIRVKY